MRILLELQPTMATATANYGHLLVATLHKWIADDKIHDGISLYSFSKLMGCKFRGDKIVFSQNPYFIFSAWDGELVRKVINGIMKDPSMFEGLFVKNIIIQETPDFSEKTQFGLYSPIYISRTNFVEGGKPQRIVYNFFDAISSECMIETMKRKMAYVGIDEEINIEFDRTYCSPQIKFCKYKNFALAANFCPIIIEGGQRAKEFAWSVGVGNNTGLGFGCLI